ncbi:MAG: methylmalonyl Co-A mutase-associated GTPase MeaB [Acidimicrobiales bacterium]
MRGRDPGALSDALLGGDRSALPRVVSIVEAGGSPAREVGRRVYGATSGMFTVGITGPPGAGKSTLTDRLIGEIRAVGSEVAVLAVDPSSPYSGGALLGDRVRMMDHALDPGVFVRSMATRGHLGGLALAVPEVLRVLDAAGFPMALIETVGVGQSEVEIAGAADTTMVVLTPGAGDSVQANKAGLLEVADLFVINKSDHPQTGELERDLGFMMELTSWPDGWIPPIVRTIASTGDGVEEVVAALDRHRTHLFSSGLLDRRRAARAKAELRRILAAVLEARARSVVGDARWEALVEHVVGRRLDPWSAADEIIEGVSRGGSSL